ncbi:hypothetical protein ACLOJK_015091 [Asimina triloba]
MSKYTIGAPSSGAPSSPIGYHPTHLRRGSDRLIGAIQKISHDEMIGVGEPRRRAATQSAFKRRCNGQSFSGQIHGSLGVHGAANRAGNNVPKSHSNNSAQLFRDR